MKNIFARSLLLSAALALSLVLNAQYRYLDEQFVSSLGSDWTFVSIVGETDNWRVADGALTFAGHRLEGRAAVVSPVVDLTVESFPVLRFSYRADQFDGNVDPLYVSMRVSPDSEWVRLMSDSVRHKQYVVYTNTLVDSLIVPTAQFKIEACNKGGAGVCLDWFTVSGIGICAQAVTDFAVKSMTQTSVEFIWKTNDKVENSRLIITKSPIDDFESLDMSDVVVDSVVHVNSIANLCKVESLENSMQYYAYLRADCGYDDYSEWLDIVFTTPCKAQAVPFTDDFESYEASDFGCWETFSTDSLTVPAVAVSDVAGMETKTVAFDVDKDVYTYFRTPQLDADDIRKLGLLMDIYTPNEYTDDAADIVVGIMTNPLDLTTFTPVHTVSPAAEGEWQTVHIGFNDYTGDNYGDFGNYIVLRVGSADKRTLVRIDNVRINTAGCITPQMLRIEKLFAHTACISWTEMTGAEQWIVRYADRELSTAELVIDCDSDIVVSEPKVTIEKLEHGKDYYVCVKSDCGEWSDVLKLTTNMVYGIGYTDTFGKYINSFPPGIVRGQIMKDGGDVIVPSESAVYIDSWESYPSGSGSLNLDMRNTYMPFVIFPEIDTSEIGRAQVAFVAKMKDLSSRLIVSVCTEQDITTAVAVDTISPSVAGEWSEYIASFVNYAGNGRFMALTAEYTANGYGYSNIWVDNIAVLSYDPCSKPQGFRVDNVGADATASLSWKKTASASSQWQIEYRIDTAKQWQMVDTEGCGYTLENLTLNRTYQVRLRMICSTTAGAEVYSDWTDVLTFRTPALTEIPYVEDFTTDNAGIGVFPYAWHCFGQRSQYGADSYVPCVVNTEWLATDGSVLSAGLRQNSLQFNTMTYYFAAYAVLPELEPEFSPSDLAVEFSAYSNSEDSYFTTYEHEVEVGVMSDPEDASTFVPVGRFSFSETHKIHNAYVSLRPYQGDGRHIAFRAGLNNDGNGKNVNILIDNLRIDRLSECATVVGIEAVGITADSVTLDWLKGNAESEWNIRLFDRQVALAELDTAKGNLYPSVVTQKPLTIGNLEANTDYWVAIQAKTTGCVGSWSNVYTFHTNCPERFTMPFEEKFNDEKGSVVPRCWMPKTGDELSYLPKLVAASRRVPDYELGRTAGNVLQMSVSAGYSSYLILPEMDEEITATQISFHGYSISDDPIPLEIGVMEDVDSTFENPDVSGRQERISDSLFTSVDKVVMTEARKWKPFTVLFEDYKGKGKRIALRIGNGAYGTFYIDNVTVQRVPPCTKISQIEISELTAYTATFGWTAKNERNWNVKVAEQPIDPTDISAVTVVSVDGISENPYTVTNLKPDTRYWIYVQRVNKTDGCVGEWSDGQMFTTQCLAIDHLSFFDGFESNADLFGIGIVPRCWTAAGTTVDAVSVDELQYVSSTETDRLCLYLFNSSSHDDIADRNTIMTSYAVLPELGADSVEMVTLSFKAYRSVAETKGGQFEVGVMTDPSDPTTYSPVYSDRIPSDPDNDGIWTTYTINFTDYECDDYGEKGKYLVIRALPGVEPDMPGHAANNTIMIDSVVVAPFDGCSRPMGFHIDTVTDGFASFSWMADSTDNMRLMVSRRAEIREMTPVLDTLVHGNKALISNLPQNSCLYARLAYDCDDIAVVDWSNPVVFRTLGCNVQVPYIEGFEQVSSDLDGVLPAIVPACYNAYHSDRQIGYGAPGDMASANMKSSAFVMKVEYATTGKNALQIGADGYAFLPVFAGQNLDCLAMTFHAYMLAGRLEVGYVTDVRDIRTYTMLRSFDKGADSRMVCGLNFADFAPIPEGARIAIRCVDANSQNVPVYIDDILVDYNNIPWTPISVRLECATNNSLTLSWNYVGRADSWQIASVESGGNISDATVMLATANIDTVENLIPDTYYDIYVRSISAGDTSAWSQRLSVRTWSEAAALPYSCDFDVDTENAGWRFVDLQPDKNFPNQWVIGSGVAANDSRSLYVSNDSSTYAYTKNVDTDVAWAYRTIEIKRPGEYVVEVMAKGDAALYSSDDFMSVAFMPASFVPGAQASCHDIYTGEILQYDRASNPNVVVSRDFVSSEWQRVQAHIAIDRPGYYNLLCRWQNSYSYSDAEPGAVDSIRIYENICPKPKNIRLTDVSDSHVSIAWDGGAAREWCFIASAVLTETPDSLDETDIIFADTVSVESVRCTVAPSTTIYLYVGALCDDTVNEWVGISASTMCEAKSLPYVQDFSEQLLVSCWLNSKGVQPWATHEYNTRDTVCGFSRADWLIMPLLDEDLCRLDITFEASLNYASDDMVFELGVMSNPYDASTFERVASFEAEPLAMGYSPSPEFNRYYHSFASYEGGARFVAFRADNSAQFYLDDIKVNRIPDCAPAYSLSVSNVTDVSAVLNWMAADMNTFRVVVSEENLAPESLDTVRHFVFDRTAVGCEMNLTGLGHSKEYYAYVRSVCSDTDGSWSVPVRFATKDKPLTLPYHEDFDNVDAWKLPDRWLRSETSFDDVLIGSQIVYEDESAPVYDDFAVASNRGVYGTKGITADIYQGSVTDHWAVSPQIIVNRDALLSLDFMLETYDKESSYVPTSSFVALIVSTDDAATWDFDNAVIVSDASDADLRSADFFNSWGRIYMDMTPYMGDTVRIAVYVGNRDWMSLNVNFDNFMLRCAEVIDYTDVAYENHDYEGYGFEFDYSEMAAGEKVVTRYANGATADACDSIINLTLDVRATQRRTIEDMMCYGDVLYSCHNFFVSEPGIYVNRSKAISGADSITTLVLGRAAEFKPVEIEHQMCSGSEYVFANEILKGGGVYRDTVSNRFGCDSVTILTLIVSDVIEVRLPATICSGEYYEFAGNRLYEEGEYRDTMPSVNLCDSITILTLTVAGGNVTRVTEEVEADALPYEYEGQEIVPAGTVSGLVCDTLLVPVEGTVCNDSILFEITVTHDVAVENVSVSKFSISPNPVERGSMVIVDLGVLVGETDGLLVEVYNMSGVEVLRTAAPGKSVSIVCNFTSGVYMVRVTTVSGNVCQSKLVVK